MGRYRHTTPILAGPIKEHSDRLSFRREKTIPCMIYKIPVNDRQYEVGLERIRTIMNEREKYLYNLYSVLTYPILKGFSMPKAFSCSEFVAYILYIMDVQLGRKRISSYTSWYLYEDLKRYVCFVGDVLPLLRKSNHDEVDYF